MKKTLIVTAAIILGSALLVTKTPNYISDNQEVLPTIEASTIPVDTSTSTPLPTVTPTPLPIETSMPIPTNTPTSIPAPVLKEITIQENSVGSRDINIDTETEGISSNQINITTP